MCPSRATCLPTDWKKGCWSSTKKTSSSSIDYIYIYIMILLKTLSFGVKQQSLIHSIKNVLEFINFFTFIVYDSYTVKPVLRDHLWDKEKVALKDR
jgi:hypothetical protein